MFIFTGIMKVSSFVKLELKNCCIVSFQMELCKDLMIAAKAGDEEEVRRLIEEGVDVNHQNEVAMQYIYSPSSLKDLKINTCSFAYMYIGVLFMIHVFLQGTKKHSLIKSDFDILVQCQVFQQCLCKATVIEQWFVFWQGIVESKYTVQVAIFFKIL